jgi:hypothetical protein
VGGWCVRTAHLLCEGGYYFSVRNFKPQRPYFMHPIIVFECSDLP